MDKIVLDYIKEPNLFDSVAKKTAESLKMSSTQMRRFYDYLIDLLVKADEKDFSEILPFIKMLNSKVAQLINEQITKELYSAYLYLDFSIFYEAEGLA